MPGFKSVTIGLFILLIGAALVLDPAPGQAQVQAVVSIPPQKYFVEKVGGDLVSVTVMVPPGADAHTYEPKPKQMTALSRARVYFAIGMEFEEAWLPRFKAASPKMAVVHTDEQVPKVEMEEAHEHGDEHHDEKGHAEKEHADEHHDGKEYDEEGHAHKEPAHEEHADEHHDDGHHHEGLDPHIWLAPKLVAIQARAIRDGLAEIDPGGRAAYDKNLAAFLKELERLDQDLAQAFAGLTGARHLLVYHPAWGYFCRAYGLEQVAVEKEGKAPTAKGLAHLIRQAKEEKAKVIFVQPQFSTRSAETLAKAVGAQVIAIDPLAPDWADNLRRVAEKVKKGLY